MRHLYRPLAVVACALTLAACTIDPPAPDPDVEVTMGPEEFSRLDDAGVAAIMRTGHARFDLRDHLLTPAEVGLGPDALGPFVGDASGEPITLELVGPTGTDVVRTPIFSVFFSGPGQSEISYKLFFEGRRGGAEALRADVDAWGYRTEDVERWLEWATPGSAGSDETFTDRTAIGSGVSPGGLVSDVEVTVEDGNEDHLHTVLVWQELYTPEVLQEIRTTGQVPIP